MKKLTLEQIKEIFVKIHGDKYDYSLINEYIGANIKLKIRCKKHNFIFYQEYNSHKKGHGCIKCSGEITSKRESTSNDNFLVKAKNIHKNEFEYLETYRGDHNKISIKHKKCGSTFEQSPNKHISAKQGCPICKESKGEKRIKNFLIDHDIEYKYNKSLPKCINPITKSKLKFDFILLDNKNNIFLIIEFDGKQHFEPTRFLMRKIYTKEESSNNYKNIIFRDKIKNEYCDANNIKLIRIHYKDIDNIENILSKHLFFD